MIKEIMYEGNADNIRLKDGKFVGAEFSSFLANEATVKLYGDLNGEFIVRKKIAGDNGMDYYFEIIGEGISATFPISVRQYIKTDKRSVYRAVLKALIN